MHNARMRVTLRPHACPHGLSVRRMDGAPLSDPSQTPPYDEGGLGALPLLGGGGGGGACGMGIWLARCGCAHLQSSGWWREVGA